MILRLAQTFHNQFNTDRPVHDNDTMQLAFNADLTASEEKFPSNAWINPVRCFLLLLLASVNLLRD